MSHCEATGKQITEMKICMTRYINPWSVPVLLEVKALLVSEDWVLVCSLPPPLLLIRMCHSERDSTLQSSWFPELAVVTLTCSTLQRSRQRSSRLLGEGMRLQRTNRGKDCCMGSGWKILLLAYSLVLQNGKREASHDKRRQNRTSGIPACRAMLLQDPVFQL